jgi:hypothetical protein
MQGAFAGIALGELKVSMCIAHNAGLGERFGMPIGGHVEGAKGWAYNMAVCRQTQGIVVSVFTGKSLCCGGFSYLLWLYR